MLICVTANYEGDVLRQHRLKVHVLDPNHNPGIISPVYNLFNAHPVTSRQTIPVMIHHVIS